jgi:hypothetical protein
MTPTAFSKITLPARVAGVYALAATLWIVVTDGLVAAIWQHPAREWMVDSGKGLLFVAASTLFFYLLVERLVARFETAEAALRSTEERWQYALEGAGEGVWDWSRGRRTIYFSPTWKAMLGYGEAEIGDGTEAWLKRVHPADRHRVLRHLARHQSGRLAALDCEHRLATKSGGYIWVLTRGRIVQRAADGSPLRAIGTQSDITARRAVEAEMADALNFNRTIVNAAPVGIVTFRADGQTLTTNEAAARCMGATVEELGGENYHDWGTWREAGLTEIADRALREGATTSAIRRIVHRGGRRQWVEVSFTPFAHGGERRLLLIGRDITTERESRERLEVLDAALQATPNAWVVTDVRGVIEWVNPAFTKVSGYTLAEVVGRTPSVLKSGHHTAGFYGTIWQALAEGRTWQGEICNRHRNGDLYHERMTALPVRDADGKTMHYVAIKEDITERRELERQLARSQRLESIGLIASGIAHDLNNMLAPIMLAVNLIKDAHRDRETVELLDMMKGAAQRGAGVVKQVLTFARGVEGERVQLDVRPLVKELGQLARETFPRNIRIVLDLPADELLVEGDVTQLHQVLLNLAVNARDAMPEGGVLKLEARRVHLDEAALRLAVGLRPGAYIRLAVNDTGTGIPPEVVEHIFEPFYTTKPRGKGTGLGLSTAYGIVRSHGGFIEVRSDVGVGTEFGVVIPASQRTPTESADPAGPVAPLAGAGRRVLVVDDEEIIRNVCEHLLRKRGFAAVVADEGAVGLRALRADPGGFSAAIIDLMMPGMSGYKLAREIRQLAPGLPIIIASGMVGLVDAGEERDVFAALGVRSVLKKPFGEGELMAALELELRTAPVRRAG